MIRITTLITLSVFISLKPTVSYSQDTSDKMEIFSKNNLVAWCIVPFDNQNRNAEERALMLNELGITKLAYDWREKHVPTFDAELDALNSHGIMLQAFWYSSGMNPEKDKNFQTIIDLLQRHHVKSQIWCMISGDKELEKLDQQQKVAAIAKVAAYMVNKAAAIGCTLGLYNHGGWFGEPENQLAVIDLLKLPNIGMVYNFSHSEYQIQRFQDFYPKMLPHLIAINITGLKSGYPVTVVPVGQGNLETDLLRTIHNSGYAGPIGIINENFAADAKVSLQMNIDGLERLRSHL